MLNGSLFASNCCRTACALSFRRRVGCGTRGAARTGGAGTTLSNVSLLVRARTFGAARNDKRDCGACSDDDDDDDEALPMSIADPADLASALMPAVRDIAREAGRIASRYFRRGEKTSARVWSKHGGSPVTEADVAVDSFLKVELSAALPASGWLSEETADEPSRLDARRVWIVDPIDGTRAFLSGHPDWSIAIALLVEGRPALGLVFAPTHELLYEAVR